MKVVDRLAEVLLAGFVATVLFGLFPATGVALAVVAHTAGTRGGSGRCSASRRCCPPRSCRSPSPPFARSTSSW
ncbi:hypothetical protein [Amycolatopsis sp. NPDC102389]|uniref:hypothetical protein n=1 Tax=Amycolatopsis sp. NPDC102389 TaxID=3363941 RepID=UPI003821D7DD